MCPMTKHKRNGNRYNDDFRTMIVDLYHSDQSVSDLSSEYGVFDVTIYAWIKKFSPIKMDDGSTITPDDYEKIQKQMFELKQENEILKKALEHFAKK